MKLVVAAVWLAVGFVVWGLVRQQAENKRVERELAIATRTAVQASHRSRLARRADARRAVPLPDEHGQDVKYVGSATPQDSLQSLLWAVRAGDAAAMAKEIFLAPGARASLQTMINELPDTSRSEYGSPEAVAGLFLAREALSEENADLLDRLVVYPHPNNPAEATVVLTGSQARIPMRLGTDGWQVVVSAEQASQMMDNLHAVSLSDRH